MAEYDFSLILYQTWLKFDLARGPSPGLIEKWSFSPKNGLYRLTLGEHKWSDGKPVLAEHLVFNLNRVFQSGTTHGKALSTTIDTASIRAESKLTLSFKTKERSASTELFNQLGSIFLAPVHPSDLDHTRLVRNRISSGPYIVANESEKEIIFKTNPYFAPMNKGAPTIIRAKKMEQSSLELFLSGKDWANYFQTSTLLPANLAKKLLDPSRPHWTRGIDRVMLLRPLGTGQTLRANQKVLLKMAPELREIQFDHPLKVNRAYSLQPVGYPLFEEIRYLKPRDFKASTTLEILAIANPSLDLAKEIVTAIADKAGLPIRWRAVSAKEFLSKDWNSFGSDFALFSLGVADPEPTTWLNLVFGSHFIQFSDEEKSEFERLTGLAPADVQVKGYRELLKKIALRGGYLPLLHGATVSLGSKGMSFQNIDPLDETVDFSKIVMEHE
jgi:Bacterial extracellular solute-binding proteins, family 5 Middle